jgi:deoxyribodipyrimidine photo-lyase
MGSLRSERVVHWFRSDLRLRDNTALAAAVRHAERLALVFVFDERILRGDGVGPPRLRFLLGCLGRLTQELAARGQRLLVRRGDPVRVVPALLRELRADRVTWNRDPGPYARSRDTKVRRAAARAGVAVEEHEDRVVFGAEELRTQAGEPFRVYTPFRNAWWARFAREPREPGGALRLPPPVDGFGGEPLPDAAALGAAGEVPDLPPAGEAAAARRLDAFLSGPAARYAADRDRPDRAGTSRLSPYLHLGAISARTCFARALEAEREEPAAAHGLRKWLDELVWREFFHTILEVHPRVVRRAFRPEYDALAWADDEAGLRAWCEGRTGYPIVDAGMRELAATGWMHNRARMIVASFLTKDLGLDWRRGERFFQQRLVDGDLAANNGGWQWAASIGTDAQPYFRIFNPVSQGERYDPEGAYVRRFVPELERLDARFVHRPWEAPSPPRGYPAPIVDHAQRRRLALRRYEAARRRGAR